MDRSPSYVAERRASMSKRGRGSSGVFSSIGVTVRPGDHFGSKALWAPQVAPPRLIQSCGRDVRGSHDEDRGGLGVGSDGVVSTEKR